LADAEAVFAGTHFTRVADRRDFLRGPPITAGFLRERFVVLMVWTPRDGEPSDYFNEART
jgi:hypothetical protein